MRHHPNCDQECGDCAVYECGGYDEGFEAGIGVAQHYQAKAERAESALAVADTLLKATARALWETLREEKGSGLRAYQALAAYEEYVRATADKAIEAIKGGAP
jgi:hypothetical protein